MKGKRADGTTYYVTCGVRRIVEITTLDSATMLPTETRVETKECDTPLFGDEERATGICRSCRRGWEVEGNRFATAAEKYRATQPPTGAAN
jgi:hypothetical protein